MLPSNELKSGDIRLLSCDNALVLPKFKNVRFMITSSDVIHS